MMGLLLVANAFSNLTFLGYVTVNALRQGGRRTQRTCRFPVCQRSSPAPPLPRDQRRPPNKFLNPRWVCQAVNVPLGAGPLTFDNLRGKGPAPTVERRQLEIRCWRTAASSDNRASSGTQSGLKPAECVRKLEGRIISFHVKDMNEAALKADEVPWGTGVSDIKGILTEVYRQRLKAVFTIEYEHVWEQSLPDIARSVRFFDQVAAELAAQG